MQKAIQQDARKTANCPRGYRTEVLRKISAIKIRTELRPELARQIPAHGDANLPSRVARLRPEGPEILPEASSRRNLASRPEKWTPRRGETDSAQNCILKGRNGTRLEKYKFFHVVCAFTPFRRRLTAASSYHSGDHHSRRTRTVVCR